MWTKLQSIKVKE